MFAKKRIYDLAMQRYASADGYLCAAKSAVSVPTGMKKGLDAELSIYVDLSCLDWCLSERGGIHEITSNAFTC
jgi:hypothetical protein